VPRQPLRKADVEVLESMERGLRGGIVIEDETLERLLKLGLVEERKRGVWSLTVRARTYLLRRKSLKRGKRATKAAPGSGTMGQ
jgi:hypothetical protein